MANFVRWEPAHEPFNFWYPWKQYLKIGSAMRNFAFCIESFNTCILASTQKFRVPEFLKNNFSDVCTRLSSHCSKVLKELSVTMKTMTKSSATDLLVSEMNFTVEELQNDLKALPNWLLVDSLPANNENEEPNTEQLIVPLIEILSLATAISLLIEITARIEGIVDAIDKLADLAEFKPADDKKSEQSQSTTEKIDDQTMKILEKV
ncbi:unnamed protein product [Camellia sinensis]